MLSQEKARTVLLDDPKLVDQLRTYLKQIGYQHGPLFRARKNGQGGLLSYQSMQQRWQNYCEESGIKCTLHQLRHSHATELVNDGVSLATIRKRLGIKTFRRPFVMRNNLMEQLTRSYALGVGKRRACLDEQ